MSDYWGESDPRAMPHHFFWGASHLGFESALKADISKQNYTVCPRYWYVDAIFPCPRCGNAFCFTAEEQRYWYEERGYYVDSLAKHCIACRVTLRKLKHRRQEYDRDIAAALQSDNLELKQRLVDLIDELCEVGDSLPHKIQDHRRILAQQIAKDRNTA